MDVKNWLKTILGKKKNQVPRWKEAQNRLLSKIEKGELPPGMVDSFEFTNAALIEGLNSSSQEERLSCLNILINFMWAEDPKEKADAIKVVASMLKHHDIKIVQKAAGGLSELGGIGIRYLKIAAQDPQINEASRVAILVRARISTVQFSAETSRNLSKTSLTDGAREIVRNALEEAKYHTFSSMYHGTFPSSEDVPHSYIFEVDLSRPREMQALLSFTRKDGSMVKDKDCLPLVRAFSQNAQFSENWDIPRSSAIRYFSWDIITTEEEQKYEVSEDTYKPLKVPNMYGLDLVTPIYCGHSRSPSFEAYKIKFFTAGAGMEEDLKYLAKVRCPKGSGLRYLRKGQFLAKDGSCARWYVVICKCGEHRAYLYIDSLRSGEVMPPDLPGWGINHTGAPSKEDEIQGMDLIFIAQLKDHVLKTQTQSECFKIVFDQEKSLLKIDFKPDIANPVPFHAQVGRPAHPQPDFAIFKSGGSSGEYICEFGNIKKKGNYLLHFMADNHSIYAKKGEK